tara:strand:+ start:709 stop:1083 length:375 start_codon:yes stop_codon:yes gene_type:complete
MNLLGSFSQNRLTLDKLNRSIRKTAHAKNIECKIFQTHDEAKVITLLQRNRNKIDSIILNLGSWHPYSHTIKDTLLVIKKPYRIVEDSNKSKEYIDNTIFEKKYIIKNKNLEESYIKSLNELNK